MNNQLILIYVYFLFINLLHSQTPSVKNLQELSFDSLNYLYNTESNQQGYAKALLYAQAGRDKALKKFGDKDSTFAHFSSLLGSSHLKMIQYAQAEKAFIQSIEAYTKVFGKEHLAVAKTQEHLANLYIDMGNFEKSEILRKESLKAYAKILGTKNMDYAIILHNLGASYYSIGRYEEAEDVWLKTKELFGELLGAEHENYALMLNNLGSMYAQMGRFEEAEPMLVLAISIWGKKMGEEHTYYGNFLNSLAGIYKITKRYDLAENLYLDAIKIQLKVVGNKHPNYAQALSNLATLYDDIGKNDKAESLFKEALSIHASSIGKMHHLYAIVLNNLAKLYVKTKKYAEAEALLLEAKQVWAESPEYPYALNNLTDLYEQMGKYDLAWDFASQTVKSVGGIGIPMPITSIWADSMKAMDIHSHQQIDRILSTFRSVYDLLNQYKNNAVQKNILVDLALFYIKKERNLFAASNDKLRVLELSDLWTQLGLKSLNIEQQKEKAFAMAEYNKSVLLLEATKSARNYQLGELPDSLVQEDKKLSKQREEISAKLYEKRIPHEKDSLRMLLGNIDVKIQAFKKMIEKNYPKYAKFKYQETNTSIKEVQNLIHDEVALIEFTVTDSVVYVFYLDKKNVTISKSNILAKNLKEKISKFHQTLSDYKKIAAEPKKAYAEYTEIAYWFYQNMLENALKESKKYTTPIKNLIIIPDGELGYLPFEAFLTKSVTQGSADYSNLPYLVKDYKISYNYSATLWKENFEKPQNKNNGNLLAIAANYKYKSKSMDELRLPMYRNIRKDLPPLPAARQEVEVLAKNFDGYFAFDSLASEKEFKRIAPDFGIIHLAMHGILDKKNPILSSLVFTEDGSENENNFLQAFEISKMQLNADLVVLSACETGFGKVEKGNGTASLARAFMYAGVPALIVSLWQVNDYSTAELMKSFYKNLANGMTKDEALQQAKLQYISNAKDIAAHPAFWSAFVQVGDSRAINIEKSNNYLLLLGILVIICILGAIFFLKKQKK